MSGEGCCCCPPAVAALFCLWCQSGCSQGTVASALTFFPPDPALYQFQRQAKDGRILAQDEEATVDDHEDTQDNDSEEKERPASTKGGRRRAGRKANGSSGTTEDEVDDDGSLVMEGPPRSGPVDAEYHGQTEEQIQSPIEQLAEQVAARRRRAKERAERDAQDRAAAVRYKLLLDPRLHVPPHDHNDVEAVKIPVLRNGKLLSTVAAVIYRVPRQRTTPNTKTILFSHGNATDIGAMFPIQVILANSLDCNVVVYDYSGYGESGGVPDENSTYKDIDVVYDYVWDNVAGHNGENIILYGQSVGSGPCCYLAAKGNRGRRRDDNDHVVGGMILHSPFTSGMRVLTPSRALACLDIYPNIDRIPKVKCPVMIIHGQLDQEVDISHGQDLYEATPEKLRYDPWWVPNRGHNDITDGHGQLAEYIRRIRRFLIHLDGPDTVQLHEEDDDVEEDHEG